MEMRNLVKEKIAANGYAMGAFVDSSSAMNCAPAVAELSRARVLTNAIEPFINRFLESMI